MLRKLGVSLVLAGLAMSCGVEYVGDDTPAGDAPPESSPQSGRKAIWDLEPGDCIEMPDDPEDVEYVDVVSCETPHVAEVVGAAQGPEIGSFPGHDETQLRGTRACVEPFERYLGVSSWRSSGLDFDIVWPNDAESWLTLRKTDREFLCYAKAHDGSLLDHSVRGIGGLGPGQAMWSGLQEGQCFDDYDDWQEMGSEVLDVIDCDEGHDNEVYAIVEHPGAGPLATYPGDAAIERFADQVCSVEFDQRVAPRSSMSCRRFTSGRMRGPG